MIKPDTTKAVLFCEGCIKPRDHTFRFAQSNGFSFLGENFNHLFSCLTCGKTRVWGSYVREWTDEELNAGKGSIRPS